MHVMIKDVEVIATSYADREIRAVIGFYLSASEIQDWRYIQDLDLLQRTLEDTLNKVLNPTADLNMVRNKRGAVRPSLIIEHDDE